MKTLLSLIITTLVLDASITRAAPVEATNSLSKSASSEPNTKLELFDRDSNAKKNGYFYPCIQPHFLHCKKYWWSAGECHKLPESRQAVGSAASNSGAYCTLYSGDNCDGDVNLPIKSPAEQIGAFHWHSWKCDCNVLRICPVAIDCDLNPKICTDAPEVDLGAEGVMALEEQHTKRDDVLPFISDDSAELIQRDDAITSKIEICSESNHRRCKIITFQTGECSSYNPHPEDNKRIPS